MILAQVIDLDGDEVKKSESVIGGGEDTVSCLLHFYTLRKMGNLP